MRLVDALGTSQIYNPSAYQYWQPRQAGIDVNGPDLDDDVQLGWTTAQNAESILPPGTALGPLHAYVGDFRWQAYQSLPEFSGRGQGLVLVEQYSVAGHYRLWQANTPTGPWTLKGSGVTPCQAGSTTMCGPLVGTRN